MSIQGSMKDIAGNPLPLQPYAFKPFNLIFYFTLLLFSPSPFVRRSFSEGGNLPLTYRPATKFSPACADNIGVLLACSCIRNAFS